MKKNRYSFRGGPISLTLFAYGIGLIGIGLPVISLFIAFNYVGKILITLIFLYLLLLLLKKAVISVRFNEDDFVLVKPLLKRELNYSDVHSIRENKEGFLPLTLLVFHLKNNDKFHFYCPRNSRPNFESFLNSKGLKIGSQI
jgi:hypothetical protein